MKNRFVAGLLLAVAAALTVLLGEAWGLDLVGVTVLGLSLGAAAAVIGGGTLGFRVAGVVVGVLLTWAAYALRAAVLPDSDLGRAVGFALLFAAIGLVAALAVGRLPFWSLLLGAAALAGAYEAAYTANPPLFASESVSAVTSVLLTLVIGLLAATAAGVDPTARRGAHEDRTQTARTMENAR